MRAAYQYFICQQPIHHLYVSTLSFMCQKSIIYKSILANHLFQQPIIYMSVAFHVQFSCLSVICWLTVGQQPEEGLLFTITSHSAVAFVKPFKCFT